MKNLINFRTFESNDNRIFEAASPVKGVTQLWNKYKENWKPGKSGMLCYTFVVEKYLKDLLGISIDPKSVRGNAPHITSKEAALEPKCKELCIKYKIPEDPKLTYLKRVNRWVYNGLKKEGKKFINSKPDLKKVLLESAKVMNMWVSDIRNGKEWTKTVPGKLKSIGKGDLRDWDEDYPLVGDVVQFWVTSPVSSDLSVEWEDSDGDEIYSPEYLEGSPYKEGFWGHSCVVSNVTPEDSEDDSFTFYGSGSYNGTSGIAPNPSLKKFPNKWGKMSAIGDKMYAVYDDGKDEIMKCWFSQPK